MLATLSFEGVTREEAERQALALGAKILTASADASGECVRVDVELDQSAKDRAALAAFGGLLRISPIQALLHAV